MKLRDFVPKIAAVGPSTNGRADTYVVTARGDCPPGTVSLEAAIEFTPTGGNFPDGTGTATVRFTLENTSGLMQFRVPAVGNPILTAFYFNVPPQTSVLYTEARILSGATVYSKGTVVNGIPARAGCTVLAADLIRTGFYELHGSSSTGQYGIFTNSLQTADGAAAGLVDPQVFVSCAPRGDLYAPLVIAGRVRFTVLLAGLGTDLDSASDFQNQCSLVTGQRYPSSFAAKYQGTGTGGEGSCFITVPCGPSRLVKKPMSAVRHMYHP